jgi:hypothetical protein
LGFKVYISSVYTEFETVRESIYQYISERATLYELIGMENYGPEDRRVIDKCIEDVNCCDIYICILGFRYGTEANAADPAGQKYSFTHWEFITATNKKRAGKSIERLIYIKEDATKKENDPRLAALRHEILSSQTVLCRVFSDETRLPKLLLKDLDNYTSRVTSKAKPRDVIYKCNREIPDLYFEMNFSNDPVQFYFLHSHDRDLPHYFVKRKNLDFELREKSVILLELQTNRFIEATSDFTILEKLMKAAIFSQLPPGHSFSNAEEITVQGLFQMMDRMNKNYMIITWNIQSIYWKNDQFCAHINHFYECYRSLNQAIKTDKKIIFFGIAKYIDNPDISQDEFERRLDLIQYGYKLPALTKITRGEVKDWLRMTGIEANTDKADGMIEKTITDTSKSEFFYSELEGALRLMLDQFNNSN